MKVAAPVAPANALRLAISNAKLTTLPNWSERSESLRRGRGTPCRNEGSLSTHPRRFPFVQETRLRRAVPARVIKTLAIELITPSATLWNVVSRAIILPRSVTTDD